MLIAGLPGVAFALLAWLTLREPPRGLADGEIQKQVVAKPNTFMSARVLWAIPTFRYMALGTGMSSFAMYGSAVWMPTFLMRSYGMSPTQIGAILGPVMGGMGAVSLLVSGLLSDRLATKDGRWLLWLPTISSLLAAPLIAGAFLAGSAGWSIALFGCGYCLSLFTTPPTMALVPSIVPINKRAAGMAWKLLMVNLVGLGLGPWAVGFLSTSLSPWLGVQSLRYAMLVATPAFVTPAILYWLGSRCLVTDMRNRERDLDGDPEGL
jgi:MFS family permease